MLPAHAYITSLYTCTYLEHTTILEDVKFIANHTEFVQSGKSLVHIAYHLIQRNKNWVSIRLLTCKSIYLDEHQREARANTNLCIIRQDVLVHLQKVLPPWGIFW
jgi:hypothetical protein